MRIAPVLVATARHVASEPHAGMSRAQTAKQWPFEAMASLVMEMRSPTTAPHCIPRAHASKTVHASFNANDPGAMQASSSGSERSAHVVLSHPSSTMGVQREPMSTMEPIVPGASQPLGVASTATRMMRRSATPALLRGGILFEDDRIQDFPREVDEHWRAVRRHRRIQLVSHDVVTQITER